MKKNYINSVILFFIIIFSIIIILQVIPIYISDKKQQQMCEEIPQRLELSYNWLINFQKEDGLFYYQYNITNNSFTDDDNIVRQIGTFYSLIRYYEYYNDSNSLNSINKFRDGINKHIKYGEINETEIAYIEFNNVSKINSNALYLLSLVELKKQGIKLTQKETEDIDKILNGILFMQNGNEGFWYLYYVPKEYNRITPYGSGEAILALVNYHKYYKDSPEIIEITKKHFKYYIDLSLYHAFTHEITRGFFSWSLQYLSELNEIDNSYYNYSEALIGKSIKFQDWNPHCNLNKNCIMSESSGESSFIEGITDIYPVLESENSSFALDIREEYLFRSLELLFKLQITNSTSNYLQGGFCNNLNCEFLRNDLNQHSTISLMNFYENVC